MTPALILRSVNLLRERDFRAAEVVIAASLATPGSEPMTIQVGPHKMKAGDVWEPGSIVVPPSVHPAASWSLIVSEIDPAAERMAQQLKRADLSASAVQLAASIFALQAGVVLVGGRAAGAVLARVGRSDELAAGAGWLFEAMPTTPITVSGPESGPSAVAVLEVLL